jgi:FkbM family methyltransferase
MFIENLINFIDKVYHQKRIVNFLYKEPIKTIVDVGSHKGEFIHYILKIPSISVIYAFEPQKKIFNILRKKYIRNKKVLPHCIALDSSSRTRKIKINKLTMTSTLSEFDNKSFFFKFKSFLLNEKNSIVDQYQIRTKSLDDFFSKIVLSKDILLKIDTEGFELNVLLGSKKNMKNFKYILIENQFSNMYKNTKFSDCEKFLKNNNFKLLKRFVFPTFHFEDRLYAKEATG